MLAIPVELLMKILQEDTMGVISVPTNSHTFVANFESQLDAHQYQVQVGIQPGTVQTHFSIYDEEGTLIATQHSHDLRAACQEIGIPVPDALVQMVLGRLIATMAGVATCHQSIGTH